MRWAELLMAGLIAAAVPAATPAAAQMGGGGGMGSGGGIGGGGGMGGGGRHGGQEEAGEGEGDGASHAGPRRPAGMKPIAREKFDAVVAAMFKSADLNHDGMVTLAELQTIVASRLDTATRDRFRAIDRNHDGRIDADEFGAWQKSLGSLAQSDCAVAAREGQIVAETIAPDLGDGERDQALAVAIEPLSALVIAKANVHYNAGVTLADLLAYEDQRFTEADRNHDDFLEQDEIRSLQRRPGPAPGPGPERRGPG